jgi:serine/threonine-protein kinase
MMLGVDMSRAKQHLSSLLERYRHLQTQDIELVLRRIFDLGEDQARVLYDLGISRDEITRITEELRRISQSSKITSHTGSQSKVQQPPKPLHYHTPSSGLKPLRGEGVNSISRQQALNQGISPRKRSVGPIGPTNAVSNQQKPQPPAQPSPVDEFTQVLLDITDRFEIFDEIAHGAMGKIDAGWDRHLGRPVAIKRLRSERAKDVVRMRFLEEAQVTGQLQHPSIITVYELGKLEGDVAFVMRRVEGLSLKELIQRLKKGDEQLLTQYTINRRIQIFHQLCQAVAYAHSRGVIHRDIKPSNVMIGDFGDVVLLDWGLCKIIGQEVRSSRSATERWQTVHGQIIGTPAYMAPEQALGMIDQITPATDVYGLGALLYHFLTLTPPFYGKTKREVVRKVLHAELIPLRERAPQALIHPLLEEICFRCLFRDVDQRYPDASALADAIQNFITTGLGQDTESILTTELYPLNNSPQMRLIQQSVNQLKNDVEEGIFHLQSIQEDLASTLDMWQGSQQLPGDKNRYHELTNRYQREFQMVLSQVCNQASQYRMNHQLIERFHETMSTPSEISSSDDQSLIEQVSVTLSNLYENAVLSSDHEAQARLGYWLEQFDPIQREQLSREVGALYVHVRPSSAEIQLWQCVPEGASLKRVRPKTLKTSPLLLDKVPAGQYILATCHPEHKRIVETSLRVYSGVTTRLSVTLYHPEVCPAHFKHIPAGTFSSGAKDKLFTRIAEIALPDFFITQHPVTCQEYLTFINHLAEMQPKEALSRLPRLNGQSKSLWHWDQDSKTAELGVDWRAEMPVVGISLDDAQRYAAWLSERDQRSYRLPTESEWEKAARGPEGRIFPWGDLWDARFVASAESWDYYLPPEVGMMSADQSVYGVKDLAGGVREWTTSVDQKYVNQGVIRGGSFLTGDTEGWLLWKRLYFAMHRTAIDVGFRLVHIPDPAFRSLE